MGMNLYGDNIILPYGKMSVNDGVSLKVGDKIRQQQKVRCLDLEQTSRHVTPGQLVVAPSGAGAGFPISIEELLGSWICFSQRLTYHWFL